MRHLRKEFEGKRLQVAAGESHNLLPGIYNTRDEKRGYRAEKTRGAQRS